MHIHPAIRVSLLMVLATVLPGLGLFEIYGLWLLLLAVLSSIGTAALRRAGSFFWRSRWLLASIALVYLAFTPGQPLVEVLPGISHEGAREALRRIGVLLVLLSAVVGLQATTSVADLGAAIVQLLRPLRWFGLNPERFSLRLSLAMDHAAQPQRRDELRTTGRWLDIAAQRIQQIETAALTETSGFNSLPILAAPPAWQWLLPLGLFCGVLAWIQ